MHKDNLTNSRRPNSRRLLISALLLALWFLAAPDCAAHQTPNTLIFLDAGPKRVHLELEMPLTELELAFGHNISGHPEKLIADFGPQLKEYLQAHIKAYNDKNHPWLTRITALKMSKGKYVENGLDYWELVADVDLQPGEDGRVRKFTLDYDVIMHQVINHAAFLTIRSDWESGNLDAVNANPIVISRNIAANLIYPVDIDLHSGSWFKGFKSMFLLGMEHIMEGTDHLLFLITLLLPASLLAVGQRWSGPATVGYSVRKILKIITAFTLGHSLTLLIGAVGVLHFPARPIEVLIAFSIFISAVNAVRPIFSGKEVYIAAGFGLVHGMAFAQSLANLHLDGGSLAISIFGFNLGIELMQLFVIALTMPSLIILSRKHIYTAIRLSGALLAGVASLAWIIERAFDYPNLITNFIFKYNAYSYFVVILLTFFAVAVSLRPYFRTGQ